MRLENLEERWNRILSDMSATGRYRALKSPVGIDFASNDYLGYGGNRGSSTAIDELGTSGLASRLLRGQHPIWEQVEDALARFHHVEAALVLNSGYTANEGLLATVLQPDDWVASDQYNHASIIDGLRLSKAERFVFRHNDLDHLESGLKQEARNHRPNRQRFVVVESLYGMDGDVAPLTEMVDLAERHGAAVIVDEAHATGCFGPTGSGLVDALGLRDRILASVHTGGKALGVVGAYVCGSRLLRELLINRCRHFIFTTALPARIGRWWLSALDRVSGDDVGRTALHRAADMFRAELAQSGIRSLGNHYIIPVVLGEDALAVGVADTLQRQGFDIRAVRPPSVPPGTARLRISIHADHTEATLKAAAEAVVRAVGGIT